MLVSRAQQVRDSVEHSDPVYGLRIGVEIAHPIVHLLKDSGYSMEVLADYPVGKKAFVEMHLGGERAYRPTTRFDFTAEGKYLLLGYRRNLYDNFKGQHHEVYMGLDYGLAAFHDVLHRYTIGNESDYFGSVTYEPGMEYPSLQAHWLSYRTGVRAEVLPRFFLELGVGLSKLIYRTSLDNFEHFYIPGFGKVYPGYWGVNYYYTLSYSLPLKFSRK